jgi:hypothetical protein
MSEVKSTVWENEGDVSPWPPRPWTGMLFRPRKTIRAIVNSDPQRHVFVLAVLFGITNAFSRISSSVGDELSLTTILMIVVIGGAFNGMLNLFLYGFLFKSTARILGGKSTSAEVRTALAWSAVPSLFSLVIWLLLTLIYGHDLFTSQQIAIAANPLPFAVLSVLITFFLVWNLTLFWLSYAEVNEFGLLRAALAGPVVFVGISLLFGLVVAALQGFL